MEDNRKPTGRVGGNNMYRQGMISWARMNMKHSATQRYSDGAKEKKRAVETGILPDGWAISLFYTAQIRIKYYLSWYARIIHTKWFMWWLYADAARLCEKIRDNGGA